ncbi:MAG: hypothetical protein H0U31_03125 [Chloroflexia bacterium]|nr:hypothetical protein [Chloroflexia bacterium]
MAHYQKPPFFLTKVANPTMMKRVKLFGMDKTGVEILTIKGRRSGNPGSVPVNPLEFEGKTFPVCSRGETEWVRNLCAAGTGTLEKEGKRTVFSVTETLNAEKPPILKDYLRRWEKDAGSYFGLGAGATLEQLAEVASKHLVIEIASTNVSGDSHGH